MLSSSQEQKIEWMKCSHESLKFCNLLYPVLNFSLHHPNTTRRSLEIEESDSVKCRNPLTETDAEETDWRKKQWQNKSWKTHRGGPDVDETSVSHNKVFKPIKHLNKTREQMSIIKSASVNNSLPHFPSPSVKVFSAAQVCMKHGNISRNLEVWWSVSPSVWGHFVGKSNTWSRQRIYSHASSSFSNSVIRL